MKKLLLITFRQSLEDDLGHLLHEIGVKNYTLIPGVLGMGKTGTATSAFGLHGLNSMLLIVLDEEQEKSVLEKLKAFHNRLATQQPSKIPPRLFVLPCDQII
jgi:nitrogen regulatory protein PII